MAPGKYEGTIVFYNDDIGEFWYQLTMTAVEPPPINLDFECELGKCHTQTITLDNPSNEFVSPRRYFAAFFVECSIGDRLLGQYQFPLLPHSVARLQFI